MDHYKFSNFGIKMIHKGILLRWNRDLLLYPCDIWSQSVSAWDRKTIQQDNGCSDNQIKGIMEWQYKVTFSDGKLSLGNETMKPLGKTPINFLNSITFLHCVLIKTEGFCRYFKHLIWNKPVFILFI